MMGKAHAITGTLAFACSTLVTPVGGPLALAIGFVMTTGGALLPDIDHPDSTATKTYGPVTKVLSWVVDKVSGGHRRGTHSILGIGLLWFALHQANLYRHQTWSNVLLILVMSLAASSAVRLLRIRGWVDDLLPIPIMVLLVLLPVDLSAVAPAIALGCFAHVLGDMVTPQGCPVFWPLSNKNYSFKLFKAGAWPERWIVIPFSALSVVGIVVYHAGVGLGMIGG